MHINVWLCKQIHPEFNFKKGRSLKYNVYYKSHNPIPEEPSSNFSIFISIFSIFSIFASCQPEEFRDTLSDAARMLIFPPRHSFVHIRIIIDPIALPGLLPKNYHIVSMSKVRMLIWAHNGLLSPLPRLSPPIAIPTCMSAPVALWRACGHLSFLKTFATSVP